MDDISRELEKEIARSKPKPFKQDRQSQLVVIDDFGQIKSADHLRSLVKFTLIAGIICFAAAAVFIYLYLDLSKKQSKMTSALDTAQEKVEKLTREKEMLMAKVVISGQKLDIIQPPKKEKKTIDEPSAAAGETQSISKEKMPGDTTALLKPDESAAVKNGEPAKKIVKSSKMMDPVVKQPVESQDKQPDSQQEPEAVAKTDTAVLTDTADESEKKINKNVTIEKFRVKKEKNNNDLLVRFDIRKIATVDGDVSGRIFIVLKPEKASQDQWLVVPTAVLKDGIPSEYAKGQYFSISNFKPVKFRIKNQPAPDFFDLAAIFIFNEEKDLIFEKQVDITRAQ